MISRAASGVLVAVLLGLTGPASQAGDATATPVAAGSATATATASATAGATVAGVRVPGAVVVAVRPVLSTLDAAAPVPTPAVLQARLAPMLAAPALGRSTTLDVVDVTSGRHLAGRSAAAPQVAASTIKLLTGAAALSTVGPDSGLPTRVVTGATAGEVVLVGGGDVLLAAGRGDPGAVVGHAGLADLAGQTAAALRARGVTAVALRLDDTLFAGPTVSPTWAGEYVAKGFVAPVTAIAVDAGRVGTGHYAARRSDPSMAAAKVFAARLVADGITVRGAVSRGRAPGSPEVLGEVTGAPLGDVVEFTLTTSDNTVAEVLARLVARARGMPATFAGGGSAVLARIAELGVPTAGAHLSGGSGLGRGDVVAAATLTGVLALAASADHPELRAVLTGLPVAGETGTLADRFAGKSDRAARGVVRAKTGSLIGVNTLAGVVVDADGRLLAFAVLADSSGATTPARAALDRVGATLAGCGCR